jgi:GNAT superfamily N-acetyltransferase
VIVADLLAGSRDEYTRYFHPFEFKAPVLEAFLAKAVLDQWFLLEVHQNGSAKPAGFYMLRGLDEGFPDPMYGVFVAEEFAGLGLARLTLAHAETQCRLNGWHRLRLKVDPNNARAHRIYQSAGFVFERMDPMNAEQVVLCREIAR